MRKKTVLITGGRGFVGSHLIKRLIDDNYSVISVVREKGSKKKVKELVGDVTDWNFINKIFQKYPIDTCLHLAGKSLVDEGTSSPRDTLKNNIHGTLNILEASRLHGVKRIIVSSTAHVYGDNEQVPYKEYYTPRPSRIYETSKTCSDIIAQSYYNTYDLPVFIGRFTNIYGPGDLNFSRIIPKTIKHILQGKNPEIWGGQAVRDYLYIDDAIDAYIKLMKTNIKRRKNHIFNFGSGTTIGVKDLVKKIIDLSDLPKLKISYKESDRKDEIRIQYVSYKKAQRVLLWKPQTKLEEGLQKTLEWYKTALPLK